MYIRAHINRAVIANERLCISSSRSNDPSEVAFLRSLVLFGRGFLPLRTTFGQSNETARRNLCANTYNNNNNNSDIRPKAAAPHMLGQYAVYSSAISIMFGLSNELMSPFCAMK
jgi:hypothetical protein